MAIHDWYVIGNIIRIIILMKDKTLDSCSIYTNRIKWLYKYWINQDRSRNYIIDRRKTVYVIYCDGHFISYTDYKIFMLDDGDFAMPKGFLTANENFVDLSKCKTETNCEENRFNSYIIKAVKTGQPSDGTLIIQKDNSKSNKKEVHFKIKKDGQKGFSSFSFSLYMSIPNEYKKRTNLNDQIILSKNIYGTVSFDLKIDRDAPQTEYFAPSLNIDNNYKLPKHANDTFYLGRKWHFRPTLQKIQKLNIEHSKK